MSIKPVGIALIIIGVIALAASLLADYIGLGSGPAKIGWKRLIGAGFGLVVVIVGVVLAFR